MSKELCGSRKKIEVAPRIWLTVRQITAAQKYVGEARGNMSEAIRLAGGTEATAMHHQNRIFTPDVMVYVRRLLDEHGLTDEVLVRQIVNLTRANSLQIRGRGKSAMKIEVPDNPTRLRATKLALELKGYIKPSVNMVQVVQAVADNFVELVMPFIPKERHGEFFAEAQRQFGSAASPNRVRL